MKPQELNIESEIFDELRGKFDIAINSVIRNLIAKNMGEGTLTVKLKVKVDQTVDQDGEVIYMPSFEPKINIRIGAKGDIDLNKVEGLQLRCPADGKLIIGTEQISMDEYMAEAEAG